MDGWMDKRMDESFQFVSYQKHHQSQLGDCERRPPKLNLYSLGLFWPGERI